MYLSYTAPAPPTLVGGNGMYRVAIRIYASPWTLKRCHDHLLIPEKYLPPSNILPMRFPVGRFSVPPYWYDPERLSCWL